MDENFTNIIQQWLDTPEAERDYMVGALYLLKLSGNQIMYRNNVASLLNRKTRDFIAYQLNKFYQFRLARLTHEQVERMAQEVEQIVRSHAIDVASPADSSEPQGETTSGKDDAPTSSWRPGKRDDHESLPDEIQALYVENLDILRQMRELHLELRHLSGLGRSKEVCQDSDRYPFLKELIALDKKYHANWEQYDHFVMRDEKEQVD